MKHYDKSSTAVDSYSLSAVYGWEQGSLEAYKQENNILKQRCSAHATPEVCRLCSFDCPYRKKWSFSNDH